MKAFLLLALLSSEPDLEAALQGEATALDLERRALETRLGELREARRAAGAEGRAEVEAAARQLEGLRAEAARLEAELGAAAAAPDEPIGFGALFQEARETLEADIPEDPEAPEALERLFGAAVTALERARSLHEDPERFFGPSGREVEGVVLHAGALTAFGRAPGGLEGPLVRLEGGWTLVEGADVSRVFGGDGPRVVPLAVDPAALEDRGGTGVLDRIAAGGPLAWPILGLGLLVGLVFLERVLALGLASRNDAEREEALLAAAAGDPEAPLPASIASGGTGVARVAQACLRHGGASREARAELVQSVLVAQVARMERRLSLLKLIAAVAPLLGLLGTVMGMIETFDVISVYGSGDASRLSGGISKALVTTELGLLVAVPTLFLHGALASWVDRLVDRLERVARDLPALLESEAGP